MRKVGLLAITILSSLFAADAANSAPAAGQVWSFQTPFGIVYGVIPREVVDYPTTRSAGTIVVNTSQRRLYYVLGGGKAVRYGIAVGMEGYAWSGVSTVLSKREWPDWTPTPDILRRVPNLPRHMAGGPDNPLGARALCLGDTLYRIHGTNEPWMVATSHQAAFACPMTTSSICITAPRSERRSLCSGDAQANGLRTSGKCQ